MRRLLAGIVVFATVFVVHAQVPTPDIVNGGIGLKGSFTWDPVTADSSGNPETLGFYRVLAYRVADDPRTNPAAVPVLSAETSECVYALINAWPQLQAAGVREGERLRFICRAIDAAGNEGAFSNSWEGFLDMSPPATPGRFRGLFK